MKTIERKYYESLKKVSIHEFLFSALFNLIVDIINKFKTKPEINTVIFVPNPDNINDQNKRYIAGIIKAIFPSKRYEVLTVNGYTIVDEETVHNCNLRTFNNGDIVNYPLNNKKETGKILYAVCDEEDPYGVTFAIRNLETKEINFVSSINLYINNNGLT